MKTTTQIKFILNKTLPSPIYLFIRKSWAGVYDSLATRNNKKKIKLFTEAKFIDLKYSHQDKEINFKLKIDPKNGALDNQLFLHNEYETHIVNMIMENTNTGDTVLDVGANIGHHSILMSKCAGESGQVVSFEPIPRIINQFKDSIKENKIQNIALNEFALSQKEEEIKLYINKDNVGNSSAVKSKSGMEEIIIHTKTLDSLDLPKFSFMKIDVEGYEWNVLEGGQNTILKYRPKILLEWSPIFYRLNNEADGEKILNFFLENDYKIIDLEDKNKEITKENKNDFMKNFAPTLLGQTNILCTPR